MKNISSFSFYSTNLILFLLLSIIGRSQPANDFITPTQFSLFITKNAPELDLIMSEKDWIIVFDLKKSTLNQTQYTQTNWRYFVSYKEVYLNLYEHATLSNILELQTNSHGFYQLLDSLIYHSDYDLAFSNTKDDTIYYFLSSDDYVFLFETPENEDDFYTITYYNKNELPQRYLERLPNSTDIVSIMEQKKRKESTYAYQDLCKGSYLIVKESFNKELSFLANTFTQGNFAGYFQIKFDTLGNNLSHYKINPFDNQSNSVPLWDTLNRFCKDMTQTEFLKPATIKEEYVNAQTQINFQLQWETQKVLAIKKREKVILIPEKTINTAGINLSDFIKKKDDFYYGKYQFNVKKISTSDTLFSQIRLEKYRAVGPIACLAIVPAGLGTMIATNGDKGLGGMISFFILGAGAATSYYLMTQQPVVNENGSPNTTYQVLKWCSISLTAACSITTISQFFIALSHGCKNKKAAKRMQSYIHGNSTITNNNEIKITL